LNGKESNTIIGNKLSLEDQLSTLKQEVNELLQDRAQIETKIQRFKAKASMLENDLASKGGEFYQNYEELKSNRSMLLKEKEQNKEAIKLLCSDLFPFSICNNLCHKLKSRIDSEEKAVEAAFQSKVIKNHFITIKKELEKEIRDLPEMNQDIINIESLIESIKSVLLRTSEDSNKPTGQMIFNELSPKDIKTIIEWIEIAQTQIPEKMSYSCDQLDTIKDDLAQVELDLSRTPSEEILKPIIKEIAEVNQRLGGLESEAKKADDNIAKCRSEIRQIELKVDKINQDISDSDIVEKRSKLISSIQVVLNSFLKESKISKINILEQAMGNFFKKLSRKQDLINNVKIDPNNFAIMLFDKHGVKVPKHRLSSGEKQIFANSHFPP